ncbi:hypothetical protein [Bradyrhizobium sp. 5.13L]
MTRVVFSREAFRELFAFYAAKAHHDQKHEGEHSLIKLFKSSEDIPEGLLDLWSERVSRVNSETVDNVVCPYARSIVEGRADYDHASDFLHALLKELNRK